MKSTTSACLMIICMALAMITVDGVLRWRTNDNVSSPKKLRPINRSLLSEDTKLPAVAGFEVWDYLCSVRSLSYQSMEPTALTVWIGEKRKHLLRESSASFGVVEVLYCEGKHTEATKAIQEIVKDHNLTIAYTAEQLKHWNQTHQDGPGKYELR